jgi:hypothetical protein
MPHAVLMRSLWPSGQTAMISLTAWAKVVIVDEKVMERRVYSLNCDRNGTHGYRKLVFTRRSPPVLTEAEGIGTGQRARRTVCFLVQ